MNESGNITRGIDYFKERYVKKVIYKLKIYYLFQYSGKWLPFSLKNRIHNSTNKMDKKTKQKKNTLIYFQT